MKYLPILLSILLASCASTQKFDPQPPTIKIVKVPVVEDWPEPPLNKRPHLPISDMSSSDYDNNPSKVLKSAVVSIEILGNYSNKLENQLNAYRRKKK